VRRSNHDHHDTGDENHLSDPRVHDRSAKGARWPSSAPTAAGVPDLVCIGALTKPELPAKPDAAIGYTLATHRRQAAVRRAKILVVRAWRGGRVVDGGGLENHCNY
jgi:hypothetical protein